MSKHAVVHVGNHHTLYRRAVVLMMALCAVLFIEHYLEVIFATLNALHFLTLDDLLSEHGI